ncbi:hypothetical protein GCM10012275_42030 [Longimycelium tulufanense]|uniref:Uncharacterized protein n=1 Tax=Longimycelium tulufanense TaxID=907463 RepID=A0A8J3CHG0_9PSEU|nr:hypothetical protein [Longimycelium tulufanense]GGM67098.1 hypothetical protein GCM10012275_42030 [Longimycelium tulufanense]
MIQERRSGGPRQDTAAEVFAETGAEASASVPRVGEGLALPSGPSPVTDVERAFVGALLHCSAARAERVLSVVADEDLGDPAARGVLEVVRRLVGRGVAPDPAAVVAEARSAGLVAGEYRLSRFGSFVATVYTSSALPASLGFYAACVLEGAVRRRLVQVGQRLVQAAETSPFEALHRHVRAEVEGWRVLRDRYVAFTAAARERSVSVREGAA